VAPVFPPQEGIGRRRTVSLRCAYRGDGVGVAESGLAWLCRLISGNVDIKATVL
jgi:hypothetical protein